MLATTKPLSSISPVMPLTTASCADPGGRCSRFQARASSAPRGATVSVFPLMSVSGRTAAPSLPVQGALAPLVDEANGQHTQEGDHREEAEPADPAERHRPGEQE